jgi:hypothetical protein
MAVAVDSQAWAQQQFAACELGDRRRTQRLIKVAAKMVENPAGSLPDQMQTWGDLKAAYRLFDCAYVTFEAVAEPHWRATRERPPGRYLLLADTTELDFGIKRKVPGLGPTGSGGGRGFLLHSALMVQAQTGELIGVAGQTIHYRPQTAQRGTGRRRRENSAQRLKREDRESKIWGQVIDDVGPPADGAQSVWVADRGADNFEVFCHLLQQRGQWVIRASHLHRKIITPQGDRRPLKKYLRTLEVAGTYQLAVRGSDKRPARTATLEVRYGALRMPVPVHKSAFVRALGPQPIAMSVVWVREVNPPKGTKPLQWVLYTSLPVEDFEDAWLVIEYYEQRWLVEEYHKALKSGCGLTDRSLRTPERLEALTGLISVAAVRVLQIKSLARTDPDRPARAVIPPLWLALLKAARPGLKRVHDLTIGQFYREVAKLGGFLGRKRDGEPGWITLWRGWEKLSLLVRGAELASTIHHLRCG